MSPALLAPWLLIAAAATEAPLQSGTLLTYRGAVAPAEGGADVGKTFDLFLYLAEKRDDAAAVDWVVVESGNGSWSWAERFGRLALDARWRSDSAGPALLYERTDGTSIVQLKLPWLAAPEALRVGAAWEEGNLQYGVLTEAKIDQWNTWQVLVRDRFGRRRQLWVDQQSPLVVRAVEQVFMGMGEEYQLQLRLAGVERLSDIRRKQLDEGFAALRTLRGKLQRTPRSEAVLFSARDLKILEENLPLVEAAATTAPLAELAKAARTDLTRQLGRADDVSALGQKYLGRKIEKFTLADLAGKTVSDESLRGRVTVLHFWEYRDQPLKEPYGQVGYLDFVYNRHKEKGVQVYGVAVDNRLDDDSSRGAAVRSVRKLAAFMNLSYPILLDGGQTLRKFGDPRTASAELPLFVVIGPDGTITHYQVGYYEVDRDRGLHLLEAEIAKAAGTR